MRLRRFALYLLCVSGAVVAFAASSHKSGQPSSGWIEFLQGRGTRYAKYKKIPLVEGHGSYFDKPVKLQDPLTKKEFDHGQSVLEILDATVSSAIFHCSNLAASWLGDKEKMVSQARTCAQDDFLVKVWPSSQNQAKSQSCFCISKDTYVARGLSPELVKALPRPPVGEKLHLLPIPQNLNVYRPDGSTVEASRLEGVYGEDLGPGPVYLNTGTRVRYMRFYKKVIRDSVSTFEPLNKNEDSVYQVVDGGLMTSDVPAASLVLAGALVRNDGSRVPMTQVTSDMWFRPKALHESNADLKGGVLHTGSDGTQVVLNNTEYTAPIERLEGDFGLLNRYRRKDQWKNYEMAEVGSAISEKQLFVQKDVFSRPMRSNKISASLPIVTDVRTARERTGYYNHSYEDNYVWARPHIVWNIQEVGRRLRVRNEPIIMVIGNLNRKPNAPIRGENPHGYTNKKDHEGYAETNPHVSHNHGLCVDMRFISDAGVGVRGSLNDSSFKNGDYSREKTFEMIKTYIDVDPNIAQIFAADEELLNMVRSYLRKKGIRGVSVSQAGHHDHVHIGWRS